MWFWLKIATLSSPSNCLASSHSVCPTHILCSLTDQEDLKTHLFTPTGIILLQEHKLSLVQFLSLPRQYKCANPQILMSLEGALSLLQKELLTFEQLHTLVFRYIDVLDNGRGIGWVALPKYLATLEKLGKGGLAEMIEQKNYEQLIAHLEKQLSPPITPTQCASSFYPRPQITLTTNFPNPLGFPRMNPSFGGPWMRR